MAVGAFRKIADAHNLVWNMKLSILKNFVKILYNSKPYLRLSCTMKTDNLFHESILT